MAIAVSLALAGLALCLTHLLLLPWMVKRKKAYAAHTPPGPRGWPLLGSALLLGCFPSPWSAFSALRRRYGDVFARSVCSDNGRMFLACALLGPCFTLLGLTCQTTIESVSCHIHLNKPSLVINQDASAQLAICLRIGRQQCLVVSSFEAIREVMITKASHFAHRPNLMRFDAIFRGDRQCSVALCDWSAKQRQRREVAFPFTHPRGAAASLASAIESEMARLVDTLRADGQDVSQALLVSCANQFYLFFCGVRFDEKDTGFQRVLANYGELFRSLFHGHAIDFLPWTRWFGGRRHLQRLSELSSQVSHFTDPLVGTPTSQDPSRPILLVDLLMRDAHLPVSEAQIVLEDLMGGHSVLHNLALWALAFVAHHPGIQERLRAEAEEVTEGRRMPLLADRPRLCFAEATVLEVLRFVSSPVIPHRAGQDTTVQGYHVAKDTVVFFNTADLNRDPTLWKDPLEFNPQRFLDADGLPSKPDYFLPFGTGRRSCLGDCIVKASLLLTLSSLALRFHVRLGPGQQPPLIQDMPDTLIWPAHTMHISFLSRA